MHPRPTTWNTVIEDIHRALVGKIPALALVPFDSWVDQLRELQKHPGAIHRVPAIKLLDFFEGCLVAQRGETDAKEAMGFPRLEVHQTAGRSDVLFKMPSITTTDIFKWLCYWKV